MKKTKETISINNILGIVPPQCVDVEKTLLAQLLIDGDIMPKIAVILRPEMFYNDSHLKIYTAINELFENSIGINMITVIDKLRKLSFLEAVGGAYFITQLTNEISTSTNHIYHAQIIHQTWLQRFILNKAYELQNLVNETNNDVEESKIFIDELKNTVDFEVSSKTNNYYEETIITVDEVIPNTNYILKLRNSLNGKDYVFDLLSENSASCIFGGAGSRKSTFISLISSIVANGSDLNYLFAPLSVKTVIFDTEQSREYAQRILRRAIDIVGFDVIENLSLFTIKQYNNKIKKLIVEQVIIKQKPKLVFIDNIRDFVLDINSFKECAELVEWLKYLQSKYNLHTCLIIHRNKADANARGHLGTEIHNMCETHINIELDSDNDFQSKIKFTKLRSNFKPPDEILQVDEDNIPSLVRGLSVADANILFNKKIDKDRPF